MNSFKKGSLAFMAMVIAVNLPCKAQQADTSIKQKLVLSLPVFDFPYHMDAAKTVGNGVVSTGSFFGAYANPSMHQSLDLAADMYTGAHYAIKKLFYANPQANPSRGRWIFYSLTLCAGDFILTYAPGCDGWEHEEYHRAVLSRFHVNSFNDMNKFPLGSELINVSHVKDEDLIKFKQESPHDFVRAHEAGIEGEYLLVDKLQRNNFYYNQGLPHEVFYLLTSLNSIAYVMTCSDPKQADKLTDDINEKEKDIPVRDFTGLDFLAWTYDLFRPNEPYTARGTHPSGIGANRYIKTPNLTSAELLYLRQQGILQWLNALSPMMVGYRSIKLSEDGLYGNIAMHDYLTSFGNDISCNVYLKKNKYNMFFAYHSYQNYNRTYPAIEAQLIDWVKPIGGTSLYLSPRILLGWQPYDQTFKTNQSSFLGLMECKIELKSKRFLEPYVEISAKTKGWVAGNEFLNESIGCRVGLVARLNM